MIIAGMSHGGLFLKGYKLKNRISNIEQGISNYEV
jgi:hypothetical protein